MVNDVEDARATTIYGAIKLERGGRARGGEHEHAHGGPRVERRSNQAALQGVAGNLRRRLCVGRFTDLELSGHERRDRV